MNFHMRRRTACISAYLETSPFDVLLMSLTTILGFTRIMFSAC